VARAGTVNLSSRLPIEITRSFSFAQFLTALIHMIAHHEQANYIDRYISEAVLPGDTQCICARPSLGRPLHHRWNPWMVYAIWWMSSLTWGISRQILKIVDYRARPSTLPWWLWYSSSYNIMPGGFRPLLSRSSSSNMAWATTSFSSSDVFGRWIRIWFG
jgi:hypothetical protein